MFSSFPPFLPSDFMLENLSQTFNGVYTPWDSPEVFTSPESYESFVSNSSSDVIQSPEPVFSCQTSDYLEKCQTSDFTLENISQTFNGVCTPWDSLEVFPSPESHESFVSNSSSDAIQSPEPVLSCQSSDYPEKKMISDPEEMNQDELIIFERKQRRRMSNRESAKRSRMRKQKHVEKLKIQVNRLTIQKRELSNRLLLVLYQNQRLRNENDLFLSEYSILREKLSKLRQLLVRRQSYSERHAWPYENLMTQQNAH